MNRVLNQTGRLAVVAVALTVTLPAWANDPANKDAAATTPASKSATTTGAVTASKDAPTTGTATASHKAKKAHRDVGINQPGAAGNVGHPGATPVAGPTPGVAGNAGPGH